MNIYYYRSREPNFGDDLNGWVWYRLLDGISAAGDDLLHVGIGTILTELVPRAFPATTRFTTLGSGVGYAAPMQGVGDEHWPVALVRGPLSASALGLGGDHIGTDGAVLLATLPEFQPVPESQRSGIVFMPHHKATEMERFRDICARADVEYLDPRWDSYALAKRISTAKLVLADAMHLAIVADTLRVPWVPLVSSPQISTFKWMDWTLSMNMQYDPVMLPPISRQTLALNRRLHWFNELNEYSGRSEEAAMTALKSKQDARIGRFGHYALKGRYRAARALSNVEASISKAPWHADALPDVLRDAKTLPGNLSADDIYREKLALMTDGLDKLKAVVAS